MKSAAKDVKKAKEALLDDKESNDLFKEAGVDSEKMMNDNVVQEYLENKKQKEKAAKAEAEEETKAEEHSSKSNKKHKHKNKLKKAKGLA